MDLETTMVLETTMDLEIKKRKAKMPTLKPETIDVNKFYEKIKAKVKLYKIASQPANYDLKKQLAQSIGEQSSAMHLLSKYNRLDLFGFKKKLNNKILLEFWRVYSSKVNTVFSESETASDNVVYFNSEAENHKLITLTTNKFIERCSLLPNIKIDNLTKLEELQLNLLGAIEHGKQSLESAFLLYIKSERKLRSKQWKNYCVVNFLNIFLSRHMEKLGDGKSLHTAENSSFNAIFSNNNGIRLKIYLDWHYINHKPIKLSDVVLYLKNQRQYLTRLSLKLSREETFLENKYKDKLTYIPEENIVRLPEAVLHDKAGEAIAYCHKLEKPNYVGCPFTRSIGVKESATLEVYAYFDSLFLRVIRASPLIN